ncbi:MAG: molybdopterin molybdotransferase MoeA [Bdellovibrionaceae bacterium]|nr:molybdopterin molybdotransferase MoeA [Pseudobdellovibrionaceae bacterium]
MILYNDSLQILEEAARDYIDSFVEEVALAQSVERILAEDLRARENSPAFDNSAMDGFAVNTEAMATQINSTNDWIPVQATIGAGDTDFKIEGLRDAVEIMTGAPIPDSYFDSVVRIEDVQVEAGAQGKKLIKLKSKPVLGGNIRRAGADTREGDLLLSKGDRVSCKHLLVLASQGISRLKVKKPIKIGILSTGKEIVEYETDELRFGQIRNSTGVYLEAALANASCAVKNYGIVRDKQELYIESVRRIFNEDVDILVSTGAVSMGAYDFVKPALKSIGAEIRFHKCAIRPGKPILFATIVHDSKTRFIFGVPGNPISTMVGLKFFIKPFIDLLLKGKPERPLIAVLATDTKKPEGLRCFYKAKVFSDGPEAEVESLKEQGSFMVKPLLKSNAWVVFPEEGTLVKRGTPVEVFSL